MAELRALRSARGAGCVEDHCSVVWHRGRFVLRRRTPSEQRAPIMSGRAGSRPPFARSLPNIERALERLDRPRVERLERLDRNLSVGIPNSEVTVRRNKQQD